MKEFCKEQLEKQTLVHGMEMAHEDFSCSVRAGGSPGARRGLARSSPAPGRIDVFLGKQPPPWMVWDGLTRIPSWAGRLRGVLCPGTPAGLSANAVTIYLAMNLLKTLFFS